jgi:hypothetical protein
LLQLPAALPRIAASARASQTLLIAGRYGLLINIEKTKYMFYNIPRPVNSDERVFIK